MGISNFPFRHRLGGEVTDSLPNSFSHRLPLCQSPPPVPLRRFQELETEDNDQAPSLPSCLAFVACLCICNSTLPVPAAFCDLPCFHRHTLQCRVYSHGGGQAQSRRRSCRLPPLSFLSASLSSSLFYLCVLSISFLISLLLLFVVCFSSLASLLYFFHFSVFFLLFFFVSFLLFFFVSFLLFFFVSFLLFFFVSFRLSFWFLSLAALLVFFSAFFFFPCGASPAVSRLSQFSRASVCVLGGVSALVLEFLLAAGVTAARGATVLESEESAAESQVLLPASEHCLHRVHEQSALRAPALDGHALRGRTEEKKRGSRGLEVLPHPPSLLQPVPGLADLALGALGCTYTWRGARGAATSRGGWRKREKGGLSRCGASGLPLR
ncbi:putative transmembrane protein [Toxoplasma gondii p89]|uniref:Putative transmembrane protein n=3 Tax=Toxoplasma gondii TaxID=5811 RepID=A0A086JRS6_TOXGO|nr:putative transmembrane protein [Toxoplasma gondii FOU]KFG37112.1 putative transmembrane protein [Toxoplasma gondii p89]RQX70198.1 putative transmembrane protein [Toxoplasma gondii CAST]